MATYVLVHGSYHGGWCWRKVTPLLRAAGHDVFTATANLAGIPAMSVPIGRVDGLPVGGQFLATHFDERQMFVAAYALERALGDEAHR